MDKTKEKKDKVSEDEPKTAKQAAAEKREENIENDIEKNIRFHMMPKKYKTSASPADTSKTKMIGAIIIGFGFLVMIGLIIAAYMYFIKPQTEKGQQETQEKAAKKQEIVTKKEQVEEVKEDKKEVASKEEEENKEEEEEEEKGEEKKSIKANIGSDDSSTSTKKIATSSEEIATSTDETSTSTAEDEAEDDLVINTSDSDNDGLFDKEEQLLGSLASSTDTDGDGYDDLSETLSLYNPVNTDKLYSNDAISRYENEYLQYSLLYPKEWNLSVVGNNDSVVFAIGDGSFINLIAQPNKEGAGILSWVKDLLPKSEANEEDIVSGDNWQGLYHNNGRIFYLTDNDKENVYIFDYSPAQEDSLDYYNLFKVMINSFEVDN